jgi:integral membrane protein
MESAASLRILRITSTAEGYSLLVLLFLAMPLKYLWHWPIGVRVVGALHGILFVALMLMLFQARINDRIRTRQALALAILAVLPFGFLGFSRVVAKPSAP